MKTTHNRLYRKLRSGPSNGSVWHTFYVTVDDRRYRYYASLFPESVRAYPAFQRRYGGRHDVISTDIVSDADTKGYESDICRAAHAVIRDMGSAFGLN